MSPAPRSFCFALFSAGVLGFTGITLSAVGAHGLKAILAEHGMLPAWETAARYQLYHAAALVGLAAWLRASPGGRAAGLLRGAAYGWSLGVVLFSVSLYWLALGGPSWLGRVTPFGGLAFMTGWLLLAIAAFSKRE